jgi:hypothetical protein
MKALLTLVATVLASQIVVAQLFTSSFETWTAGMPDGWGGSATHSVDLQIVESNDAQSGSRSCQLVVANGASHRRFSTTTLSVTNATVYQVSFWVKGSGEIRTGLLREPSTYQAYNSYIQVSSSTWTNYTQTITAGGTGNAQFIFSVINTAAPDHLLIDNVSISEVTVNTVSIYDIQYTTNPNGDSPLLGQTLTTTGVVTGTYQSGTNYGYFMQDGDGAWNGIHVFQGTNSTLPSIGNAVQVTGTVAEFNGLTQLTGVTTTVTNPSGTLPTPVEISTLALSTEEQYEGVLVRVTNVECTDQNSGFGMWEINDGTGPAKVHNFMFTYTPTLGAEYNLTGVVNFSFDEFRICYRNEADIELLNSNVDEVTISEIQFTAEADGVSPYSGQTVTTSGIVTGIRSGDGYFIQDGSGAWNGIYVYSSTNVPAIGDLVRITANVTEYFGMTQLSSISSFENVSSGNTLPDFAIITSSQVNTEAYEAVLVRVENAVCTNANAGFGMWEINNGTGPAKVDDDIFSYTPVLGTAYNVHGPVFYSFSEFKILPRFTADIQLYVAGLTESDPSAVFNLYPNPSKGDFVVEMVNFDSASQISVVNVIGETVYFTDIKSNATSISLDNMSSGVYFVNVLTSGKVYTQKLVVH